MTFAPDHAYRPSEIWRLSGLPRDLVYEALHDGSLVAVKRGRSFIASGAAVAAWIEGLGET